TVVTVIKENNHVTFFNSSVEVSVYNRLNKLVSNTFIIRLLYSLNHAGRFFTGSVYQQIISFFHTFPTFVTVHSIIATYDRSNLAGRSLAVCIQLLNKAFSAFRICITTIHKTVNKCILNTIFFGYITKLKQMIERTMYSTVRSQPHEMNIFAILFGIRKSRNDSRVLHNAIVATSQVNLHQVLINHTTRTDV